MKQKIIKHIRLYATFFFLILLLIIGEMTGLREQFNITNFKIVFENNLFFASLIYILLFTLGNIMYIPGWVFLAGAIVTIGTVPGYLLTLAAGITSTIISFFLIKLIGKDSLQKIEWNWVKRSLSTMHKHPLKTNIGLRIVLVTAPWLNYTLALSGLRFKDYLLGAIFGLPIPILIYTFCINIISAKLL